MLRILRDLGRARPVKELGGAHAGGIFEFNNAVGGHSDGSHAIGPWASHEAGTLDIVNSTGDASEAEMDPLASDPYFDHTEERRWNCTPKAAGQRVIAAAHRPGIRLADSAAHGISPARARAAAPVYGEHVNGEALGAK